jgi:hypothetical protein
VNDTTTPPDAGTAAPGEAEVQIYGGYMVKYRVSKDVPGSPHARVLVYIGEDEARYRLTGTLVMLRAEADAFMREAALPAEGKLADAENAIGQAIREVESWAMEGKPLDPSEVQRVLLGIIFRQWLGGLRLPEAAGGAPEAGVAMIRAERLRQVAVEGYTPEHDAEHTDSELAEAAAAYLMYAIGWPSTARDVWPFHESFFKPSGGELRDLVRAGALIAAEIDRTVALKAQEGSNEEGRAQ